MARQPEPRCITPPEDWSSRGLFLGITRRVLDYQKGLLGFRQAVVDPALSLEGLGFADACRDARIQIRRRLILRLGAFDLLQIRLAQVGRFAIGERSRSHHRGSNEQTKQYRMLHEYLLALRNPDSR
ncbi:hypothetical protein EMIT093MI4_30423 [Pseudomonas sp. IT-93MI4]